MSLPTVTLEVDQVRYTLCTSALNVPTGGYHFSLRMRGQRTVCEGTFRNGHVWAYDHVEFVDDALLEVVEALLRMVITNHVTEKRQALFPG